MWDKVCIIFHFFFRIYKEQIFTIRFKSIVILQIINILKLLIYNVYTICYKIYQNFFLLINDVIFWNLSFAKNSVDKYFKMKSLQWQTSSKKFQYIFIYQFYTYTVLNLEVNPSLCHLYLIWMLLFDFSIVSIIYEKNIKIIKAFPRNSS